MNAHGVGEVVLGPSTSQLLDNLGYCYSRTMGPGDEVDLPLMKLDLSYFDEDVGARNAHAPAISMTMLLCYASALAPVRVR